MTTRGTNKPLEEAQWREIFAIIAVGCGRATAARYVGCSPATIRRAEVRDPEIRRRLARAESQCEVVYLRNIQEAAKIDRYWRAAAWILERTLPAKYSARPGKGIPVLLFREFVKLTLETVGKTDGDETTKREIIRRLKQLFAHFRPRQDKKKRTTRGKAAAARKSAAKSLEKKG